MPNESVDKYIGITIGPIYETISLSSSPAALWAASYLFSHMAKRISEELVSQIANEKQKMISPCVDGDTSKMIEGIGLFPDRVIFRTYNPETDMKIVKEIFKKVKAEIADLFDEDKEAWFEQYLQFYAVEFPCNPASSPILASARYLDAIELERTFPAQSSTNPMLEMFESDNKNTRIRENIKEKLQLSTWPFAFNEGLVDQKLDGETMPKMEYIVGKESEQERKGTKAEKSYSYYALVQSDGDNFGKYIERIGDPAEFSRTCLHFCSESAKCIQNYGGITIYAGGDDLLFIAPLWERPNKNDVKDRRNILDLLDEIKQCFARIFHDENAPTISIGVAIRYYKYPLYEAFSEVHSLLFHEAKQNKKNSLALSLKKHSGKTVQFVIEKYNEMATSPAGVIPQQLSAMIKDKKNGDFLKSVSTKIWQFKSLFMQALGLGETAVVNIMDNTFDSDIHNNYSEQLNETIWLLNYLNITEANAKESTWPVREIGGTKHWENLRQDKVSREEKVLYSLDALLRIVKFFAETGEEERGDE